MSAAFDESLLTIITGTQYNATRFRRNKVSQHIMCTWCASQLSYTGECVIALFFTHVS